MSNYSLKLKMFLAREMAKVDSDNVVGGFDSFYYHYDKLSNLPDFELLEYYIKHNGVFDGGEDFLQNLNPKKYE